MRRLTEREELACGLMARAKLAGGQDDDDVEDHLVRYLVARGWTTRSAQGRASEVVMRAIAERNGVAGGGALYL